MRQAVDDLDEDFDDEEGLVELGVVLDAITEQRTAAATTVASSVLRTTHKTPPNDQAAERAVLGAMLMSADAIEAVLTEGLASEHFYRPAHGKLFGVMLGLSLQNEPVDVITVVDALMKTEELVAVGGATAVSELAVLLPTTAHAASYARLIKDKAAARRLIAVAVDAVAAAFAQAKRSETIIDDMRRDLTAIEHGGARAGVDIPLAMDEVVRRMPALGGTRRTVGFGIAAVDSFLYGGVEPQELVVVAARPSMGKTQFVLDIFDHLSINRRERAIFFSLEMDEVALLTRLAGTRAGINTNRKDLTSQEKRDLWDAINEIKSSNLIIHAPVRPTMAAIQSICRAELARGPIAAIALDHLAYVEDGKVAKGANRDEIVGQHTRSAKTIARMCDCPFLLLAQLNRGVESRPNKRPMMSDLRESGNIEQDADIIMMLYREEYYERERTAEEKKGVAENIIVKNRNGKTGSIRMGFKPKKEGGPPRFLSMADEDEWPPEPKRTSASTRSSHAAGRYGGD